MTSTLTAAIIGLVNALLVVITQFGASVSETQQAAITALVNAGLVLITAVWASRKRSASGPAA